MPKYTGHKNWAHWNVSLWINNDEGLYNTARGFCRRNTKQVAAELMLQHLHDCNIHETPDGARYTKTSIRAAMVEM